MMDQHSNFGRTVATKIHTPLTAPHNPQYGHPQLRMAHNTPYTSSQQDLHTKQQQKNNKIPTSHLLTPPNNYTLHHGLHGKQDLSSSGNLGSNANKGNHIGSVGTSPTTPKTMPSFLQGRNNMKNSLFMSEGESNQKAQKPEITSHGQNGHVKRQPRLSEQPEMKSSGMQFATDTHKVPSFLQKKQKKAPYSSDQQSRPQSSKQQVYKSPFQIDSLSSSYGSMKRSKIGSEQTTDQIDPSEEWIKKSWSKRKQRKLSINDFVQIKVLGSGKYGKVYLVKDKKTNFICALKIIQKKLLKEQQITEQFIRQLKIQSCLNHPNIIRMYSFFDDQFNIYIIMEVGTGGQLYKQIKKHQCMSEPKVASIMRQVCQAVNELHSNHIIHRDIKPENIVLSQNVVKLCDFGWSVYSGQTLRTTFCGTPFYVGPEILKGKQYDEKIDIWALGVMVYEMLIGENPFKITKQEQLIKIIKDQIKIPSYIQISQQAKSFLFSCLQKDPADRLSIRELLNHDFFKKYPDKTDKKMVL